MGVIAEIQAEQRAWARRNFGPGNSTHSLLGVAEEAGELAHAHLKRAQGIRHDAADYEAKAKDAIGDIIIYLMDYCSTEGWDLEQVVQATWNTVKYRDWKKFPKNGMTE